MNAPVSAAVDLTSVFVWAYHFEPESVGRQLDISAPVSLEPETGFVWAHISLANAQARDWLKKLEPVIGEGADEFLAHEAHPHIDWDRNFVWGTLTDIQREINETGDKPTEMRFVLGPKFLLTARRDPVHSAHAVRRKIETGYIYESSGDIFEGILDAMVDSLHLTAQRISVKLDGIEDLVLSETLSDERGKLLKIRRNISSHTRLVTGLRAVLGRLEQTPHSAGLPETCRNLSTQIGQRVASLHSDIHYLSDRARLLQEETSSQLTEATNRSLFTLTIVTTLLLPPSLVTGFFGMNTKGLLFADSDYGTLYATIIGLCAAASVYLIIRRIQTRT